MAAIITHMQLMVPPFLPRYSIACVAWTRRASVSAWNSIVPAQQAMSQNRPKFGTPLHFLLRGRTRKRTYASSVGGGEQYFPERIRNIGIMAHIDAGKTTATERMLFYSGSRKVLGNVDDGTTQMDFLKEEKERGITIQAASTTFIWDGHRINLIDTPGHVDFTIEVERSLRVLDGAVALFDGVSGVEAQTYTVWRQARNYHVPCIAFVNKMDRDGADYAMTLTSMREKLSVVPLPIQIPATVGKEFNTIIDVVNFELLTWPDAEGISITRTAIDKSSPYFDKALLSRQHLIEQLVEFDDAFAELLIASSHDYQSFPALPMIEALKRITLCRKGVPTLCGSALKNKGIQPLLDSVIKYLPNPTECPDIVLNNSDGASAGSTKSSSVAIKRSASAKLAALAFKVSVDLHKGPVIFMRVYSGTLHAKDILFNSSHSCKERISKIFQVYANQYEEVDRVHAGNICAVVGLKSTSSGDTLVLASERSLKNMTLQGIKIPPPVFTSSIDCVSSSQQNQFEQVLSFIQKEDPSVVIVKNEETGQILISGMGELHLEIIKNRITSYFNVDVELGPVMVAYREQPSEEALHHHTYEKTYHNQKFMIKLDVRVLLEEDISVPDVSIRGSLLDALGGNEQSREENKMALRDGVQAACTRGAEYGFPVINAKFALESIQCNVPEVPKQILLSCVNEAVIEALKSAHPLLMQPIMAVELHVHAEDVNKAISDLSNSRRGNVHNVFEKDGIQIIQAEVPLSKMIGFNSDFRSLTSGRGSFTMSFSKYGPVDSNEVDTLLNRH